MEVQTEVYLDSNIFKKLMYYKYTTSDNIIIIPTIYVRNGLFLNETKDGKMILYINHAFNGKRQIIYGDYNYIIKIKNAFKEVNQKLKSCG